MLLTADGARHERDHAANGQVQDLLARWQERFLEDGSDVLLRDKTRPSRPGCFKAEATERVVASTLATRLAGMTHWTGALMA